MSWISGDEYWPERLCPPANGKRKRKKTSKAIYFDTTNQNGHQNLGNGSFMLWIFAWFQVYRGRSGGDSNWALAHRVVRDLFIQLPDKVTVGYIDNFFTSIPPLQELKESSIIVVGKKYPNALQDKGLLNRWIEVNFTVWYPKQQFAHCGKTQNMSLSF